MTNEKPILFSGPMVRAILDGRKTMTRRVVPMRRLGNDFVGPGGCNGPNKDDPCSWGRADECGDYYCLSNADGCAAGEIACPYGRPGDRLWVRETWGLTANENRKPFEIYQVLEGEAALLLRDYKTSTHYRADREYAGMRWRPSIHMPRKLSRITLEITEVRVERLQKITDDDIKAEGVNLLCEDGRPLGQAFWQDRFEHLWDDINGKRLGCCWEANPWVWVVSFARVAGLDNQGE